MFTRMRFTSTPTRRTKSGTGRLAVALLPSLGLAIVGSSAGAPSQAPKRQTACKTPAVSGSCLWVHGRLSAANGNPTIRLWKIGTRHVFSILSGPGSLDRNPDDSLAPELPTNVQRAFKSPTTRIYADFEVCPLEPEKPGEMQDACIESARHLVAEP